jgi:hypothetical protein
MAVPELAIWFMAVDDEVIALRAVPLSDTSLRAVCEPAIPDINVASSAISDMAVPELAIWFMAVDDESISFRAVLLAVTSLSAV